MEQIIIQESNFEKARKTLRKYKDSQIVFSSDDDDLNRKILEKEKISILLINLSKRKDFQKQRNSGFNQVMAKLAKAGDVTIGINLDEIIEYSGKEKSEIIARVKQNIKLCNKNKLEMKFISQKEKNKRNIYDIKSLGFILNMPTWAIKKL